MRIKSATTMPVGGVEENQGAEIYGNHGESNATAKLFMSLHVAQLSHIASGHRSPKISERRHIESVGTAERRRSQWSAVCD